MRKNYNFFVLLGLFGMMAHPSDAAQIDIVSGGYIVDGNLHSDVTDDQGNQIIQGSSLTEADAIVFKSLDDSPINIDGLDTDEFILKGNVLLNSTTNIGGGSDLTVEGYLVDNTLMGDDYSDLSLGGGILSIKDYVTGEGDDQTSTRGHLTLSNGIKVGHMNLYGDIILQKDADDSVGERIIKVGGNFYFYGGTISNTDTGNSLTVANNGGSLTIHDDVEVSNGLELLKIGVPAELRARLDVRKDVEFDNSVNITQNGVLSAQEAVFANNVNNSGSLNVTGSSSFGGNVTNTSNSSMSIGGQTIFNGSVANSGNSNVELGGKATFNGNVTNDGTSQMKLDGAASFVNLTNNGNASIVANSGVTVSGNMIAGGGSQMTFNKDVTVGGMVAVSGTSIMTLNRTTTLNNVDVKGYAKIDNKGSVQFNGQVSNSEHGRIVNDGNAVFSGIVNNSGNARIVNNRTARFEDEVYNTGNGELELNGNTKFDSMFVNYDDAKVTANGDTVFDMEIANSGNTNLVINGRASFGGNVLNSGSARMTLGGNGNELLYNLHNIDESVLRVNGLTTISGAVVNTAQASIIASGEMALNSVNNAGSINFGDKVTLRGDLNNSGTITVAKDAKYDGIVTNSNNASLSIGGKAVFARPVSNNGYMAIDGAANFGGTVYNSGTFVSENSNYFAGNVDNASGAVMSLADVNFTQNNVVINNSGVLNLVSGELGSNIFNGVGGVLNLGGDVRLKDNWASNGKLNLLSGGSIDLGSNVLTYQGDERFNLADGSGLKFNVDGVGENLSGGVVSGDVKLVGNVSLLPTFAFGLTNGTYTFVDGLVDDSAGTWRDYSNGLYDVTLAGNNAINFSRKSSEDIADNFGFSHNQAEALDAMMSGKSDNASFDAVAGDVSEMLQSGNAAQIKKAVDVVDSVSPETSPMIQQAAAQTTGQIFDVVGARLANRPFISTRYSRGMSSGDSITDRGAAWIQGMGSQAELKDSDKFKGFESKTTGVALGFEKQYDDNIRLGIGYAYSQSEIDSDLRDIKADTHSGIFYSEYKHPKFFLNFIATYGWSNYDEKNMASSADYVVDSLGFQTMAGYYAVNTGVVRFIPEIGLRYVHTKQHDYESSIGAKYDNISRDLLTGIVGARITAMGGNRNGLKIIPEAKLAFTYDIENMDDKGAVVVLPNGAGYNVLSKSMNRFGVEVGAGITAEVTDKVDLSINYEGKFRKDYRDHTGIVKGKYKF